MTEETVRGERQIDCIRISGLSSGTLGFRAMMEFARGEPTDRAASKGPGDASTFPRAGSDRYAINSTRHRRSLNRFFDSGSGRPILALIIAVSFPDRPYSAGQLVGQGDGRLVMSSKFVNSNTPLL